MSPVAEGQDTWLAELDRFAGGRGEEAPAWPKALRARAREVFEETGFPTTRHEEWRFTNVAPIATTPFRLAEGMPTNAAPIVSRVTVPGSVRLVLLNGRVAPELSDLTWMPKWEGGLVDRPYVAIIETLDGHLLDQGLGREYAAGSGDAGSRVRRHAGGIWRLGSAWTPEASLEARGSCCRRMMRVKYCDAPCVVMRHYDNQQDIAEAAGIGTDMKGVLHPDYLKIFKDANWIEEHLKRAYLDGLAKHKEIGGAVFMSKSVLMNPPTAKLAEELFVE